jgi:hypothetical protein
MFLTEELKLKIVTTLIAGKTLIAATTLIAGTALIAKTTLIPRTIFYNCQKVDNDFGNVN